MKHIEIIYSNRASKFIEKNPKLITLDESDELIVTAVKKLTGENLNIDLIKMKGHFKNHYRIRKGDLRIIIYVEFGYINSVNVVEIDFRGNIY